MLNQPNLKKFLCLAKKLGGEILDFVFPRTTAVMELEEISAEKLLALRRPMRVSGHDAYGIFPYPEPLIRRAIWEVKFRGNKKIGKLLAEVLAEELLANMEDRMFDGGAKKPILTAAPIGKMRRRERGFNQTELILALLPDSIREYYEILPRLLAKNSDTKAQTSLTKNQRLENIKNTFSVTDPSAVKNRDVFFFDDVITTGATFTEAARALRAAGAKKVTGISVAH